MSTRRVGISSVHPWDMKELRLRTDLIDWREIAGELVALELKTATYLATNPSGVLLWQELVAGSTRAKLVERLVAEYEIDDGQAGIDVDRFLDELRERNLLDE
jgi:Coenzyme PQQ synthesis protein D (PqqD)